MPDVTESTATADGRWSRIRVRTLESLAYRDYRILWTAAMLNSTGHGAKSVVVGWFTYHVTGSAVLTALALGLETLPNLLASPVGGVLADRIDRRKLMAGAAIYNALLTVGLSAMFLANRAEPWHVLVYVVVMGMGTAMGDPARTSYIAYLVPKGKLLNAFALLSLAYNVATLVGPAAAGVLIAAFGPGKTMWAAVALFLATAVVVMPLTPVSFSPQSQRPSGFSQLAEGVAAMARDPVVVALFLSQVIVYAVMVPTVYGMLPVYAAEVFDVGPAGLGVLTSSLGVGAIIGVLAMATLGYATHRGWATLVAHTVAAFAMIAFSFTTSFAVAIALLVVFNGCTVSLTAIKSSVIQSRVPGHLRGRVAALTTMSNGFFPLGGLLFGALAQWQGAPTATLLGAALVLAATAGLRVRFPQLQRFR